VRIDGNPHARGTLGKVEVHSRWNGGLLGS